MISFCMLGAMCVPLPFIHCISSFMHMSTMTGERKIQYQRGKHYFRVSGDGQADVWARQNVI